MPFKFNSDFTRAREEMQSLKKNWADKPTSTSIPKKAETGPKSLRSIAPKTSSTPAPTMTSKDVTDKKVDKKPEENKVVKKDTKAVPAQGPSGDMK